MAGAGAALKLQADRNIIAAIRSAKRGDEEKALFMIYFSPVSPGRRGDLMIIGVSG
jgi:hypothetical protein